MALRVAWREYEEKYKLQEYGQQTWQQNHGNQRQHIRDVGAYRYAKQATPAVAANASSALTTVGQATNQLFQSAAHGVTGATMLFNDAAGGSRRDSEVSVDFLGGTA